MPEKPEPHIMVDQITQKHLDRLRVRGAPSTIPGASGLVGEYDYEEVRRQTTRALELPLDRDFTIEALRSGQEKLAQTAAVQQLRVLEPSMFALHADPNQTVPHEWEWTLILPVRGRVQADEEAGLRSARIHGGMYVETVTTKGFADLGNLYTYFLGQFLPSRKQQLTRPILYHRVLDGLESNDPAKLTLAVYIPIQLSLKPPVRLVDREGMD